MEVYRYPNTASSELQTPIADELQTVRTDQSQAVLADEIPVLFDKYRFPSPCVVALGRFDGVHIGHRALLRAAREEAARRGCRFVVFTFAENGALKADEPRIYPENEKVRLLGETGADGVVLCDFSTVRDLSPEAFCRLLVEQFGCVAAFSGSDFRFGRGAAGTAKTLADELSRLGASAVAISPIVYDGKKVSSGEIRRLLAEGNPEKANRLLGEPFHTVGNVFHGNAVGRKHSVPTANTALPEDAPPMRHGVYRTAVWLEGRAHPAITNLGTCPTFGGRAPHLETFVPDFCGDLYGKKFILVFLGFLREERAFPSSEDLYLQIKVDILTAKEQNSRDSYWNNRKDLY